MFPSSISLQFIWVVFHLYSVRKHAIPTRNIPDIQIEVDGREIEVGANEEFGSGTLKEESFDIHLEETPITPKNANKFPAVLRDHDYCFTHEHAEKIHEKMQKLMESNKMLRRKLRASERKQKSAHKSATKWKNKLRQVRFKTIRKPTLSKGGNFLSELAINANRAPKGARYSDKTKQIALALYYCSAHAYREMLKSFRLPSISLLIQWMRNIKISEGFSKNCGIPAQ